MKTLPLAHPAMVRKIVRRAIEIFQTETTLHGKSPADAMQKAIAVCEGLHSTKKITDV